MMLSRRLLILFLCVPYAYVILVRGQKDNAPQIETDDASDNRRLRKSSLPIVKVYALGDVTFVSVNKTAIRLTRMKQPML